MGGLLIFIRFAGFSGDHLDSSFIGAGAEVGGECCHAPFGGGWNGNDVY